MPPPTLNSEEPLIPPSANPHTAGNRWNSNDPNSMFEIVIRELRATFLGKHARHGLCLRQLSYGLSDSLSDNTTDNSTTTEETARDRETHADSNAIPHHCFRELDSMRSHHNTST